MTTPSEEGGKGSLRCRYGLWQDGQRLRWFSIDRSKPLPEQLATIERETIESLAIAKEDLRFYSLKSPVHFYEQLSQTYVEANYHKNVLKGLERGETVKNGPHEDDDTFL